MPLVRDSCELVPEIIPINKRPNNYSPLKKCIILNVPIRVFSIKSIAIRILWWGDVDHHGLGLFRHLEEGLAASLYLVDGPSSSSSQQTTRHRFTENEIPDC
jgi:hypothetical protein